jgi:hypothetical protein
MIISTQDQTNVFNPISQINTLTGIASNPFNCVIIKNFFDQVLEMMKIDQSNSAQLLGEADQIFAQLVSVEKKD